MGGDASRTCFAGSLPIVSIFPSPVLISYFYFINNITKFKLYIIPAKHIPISIAIIIDSLEVLIDKYLNGT
jgi:hypothetical protein